MMSKFCGLLILLATTPALAIDVCKNNENTFCDVKVISVYDGDTIKVQIPNTHPLFAKMSVRIRHIDCAEISSHDTCEKNAARIAKNLAESLLKNAKQVDLENVKGDKYFRLLADVRIDGKLLSDIMLKNHLAYEYEGKAKKHLNWCEELKSRIPASLDKK